MELDARKIQILQAIILDYLQTAEPVGSRTISKNYNLGISSATIRNEMSDLEELGLIMQPHTSAGRIPSDMGYRLYVDQIMRLIDYHDETLKEILFEKVDRIELLLKEIAKSLAIKTNYATVVTTPKYKQNKLKKIQLISLDEKSMLAVIVIEGNFVKNHFISLETAVTQEILNVINEKLNKYLQGLTLQEINLEIIKNLKLQVGKYSEIVSRVLEAVIITIQDVEDIDVYTCGTSNILKCPEFSNPHKALEFIDTLEEKNVIMTLINEAMQNQNQNIQILIGNESPVKSFEECSFITTSYNLGNNTFGTIGIIGPKRMDYVKVISILRYLMTHLDLMWNKYT